MKKKRQEGLRKLNWKQMSWMKPTYKANNFQIHKQSAFQKTSRRKRKKFKEIITLINN